MHHISADIITTQLLNTNSALKKQSLEYNCSTYDDPAVQTIIIPQALTVSRVMFLDQLFLVAALLQLGVEAGKPTTLNNSSLSLILGDQCVTRDEVRDVIRNEMQSVV